MTVDILFPSWPQKKSLQHFASFHLILFAVEWGFICCHCSWCIRCSVQLFATPLTVACQTSCPSPSSRACSNSCALSQWCHPTILSSLTPFFSCLQSFLASGSFLMSQLFISGSQRIGASTSASVLPMNIQDWFPLWWTGWISLQSTELSRVFSNTTQLQFFSTHISL